MIKKSAEKTGKVKVTFVLPYSEGQAPVAVVGDFNEWNQFEPHGQAQQRHVQCHGGARSGAALSLPLFQRGRQLV